MIGGEGLWLNCPSGFLSTASVCRWVLCAYRVGLFRRGYDHERGGGRGGYDDDRNHGRYQNRAPGEDSSAHAKFSCRNILIVLVIEDLE